jgi:3-isopropylmalate/(R)-2-methylmalate dehydratase large subunit
MRVRPALPSLNVPDQTISEKILSAKSAENTRAGDVVTCKIAVAMGTDGCIPMAIDYFEAMGGEQVFAPEKIFFALDHYAPAPSQKTAELHRRIRDFAARQGVRVWEIGDGIGNRLMVESGRVLPGALAVGADSHAVTYGALNAFATGIGSSDLAAAMITGEIWLRVPESIKIALNGELAPGVFAKDVALALARQLRADGANYQALEFCGPGIASFEIDDRLVLANLSVEMGAKNGIFPADEKTFAYLGKKFEPVEPDANAIYAREISLDLARIEPQIALPHKVDQVVDVAEAAGTPVQSGLSRDLYWRPRSRFPPGSRHSQVRRRTRARRTTRHHAASRSVLETLTADGTLTDFIQMGAVIVTPGGGSCCGACGEIPGDGVNVISTANRNFKGRMGNSSASIYLASPASCAAAAVTGKIADPRAL